MALFVLERAIALGWIRVGTPGAFDDIEREGLRQSSLYPTVLYRIRALDADTQAGRHIRDGFATDDADSAG